MPSNLNINKSALFRSYDLSYEMVLDQQVSNEQVKSLISAFVRSIISPDALRERDVINFKGRDPGNVIFKDTPAALLPSEQEIFYVSGVSAIVGEDTTEEELGSEHFVITLSSQFSKFEGNSSIIHTTKITKVSEIAGMFNIYNFTEILMPEIKAFRVGLDFYRTHKFNFIGFAPEVTETFLLEYLDSKLALRIESIKMAKNNILPLSADKLLEKISSIFKEIFSFDLLSDLKSKLPE